MRGLRPRNSERDAVRNPVEECSLGRRSAGETEVTFDDKILDPRTDLRELYRTGFEWGTDGISIGGDQWHRDYCQRTWRRFFEYCYVTQREDEPEYYDYR